MRHRLPAVLLAGLLILTPAAHAATSPHQTDFTTNPTRSMPAPWQPMPLEAALVQAVMPLFGFTLLSLDAFLPTAVGQPPLGLHRAFSQMPR